MASCAQCSGEGTGLMRPQPAGTSGDSGQFLTNGLSTSGSNDKRWATVAEQIRKKVDNVMSVNDEHEIISTWMHVYCVFYSLLCVHCCICFCSPCPVRQSVRSEALWALKLLWRKHAWDSSHLCHSLTDAHKICLNFLNELYSAFIDHAMWCYSRHLNQTEKQQREPWQLCRNSKDSPLTCQSMQDKY